jgi:biotin transport system permease protein
MLSYEPGETVAHRLDPRSKLAFQIGFAVAVFTAPTTEWLVAAAGLALLCPLAARLSPLRALRAYWFVLLVLGLGPVVGGLAPGPPWFRTGAAVESLRAVARIPPVLLVSAAFVRSTPVRDTRAAVQRTVPGRAGQLLGVGVALTVRFVPVVRDDVGRIRDAIRARGGETRSLRFRARRIATLSLLRGLARSDRLAVAYNPTLPRLRFSRLDYPVLALSLALALAPLAV